MDSEKICQELITIANKELEEAEQAIPSDPIQCFVLLTEMTRMYDYLGIGKPPSEDSAISIQQLDILKWGWNLAAAHLFKPINVKGFPIRESNNLTRSHAISILFKFGCVILIRRVVDMIKSGLFSVEKQEDTFTFHKREIANYQFVDNIEFTHLDKLEDKIKSTIVTLSNPKRVAPINVNES